MTKNENVEIRVENIASSQVRAIIQVRLLGYKDGVVQ